MAAAVTRRAAPRRVSTLLLLLAGCAGEGGTDPPAPPEVLNLAVAANPGNVLSAVLTADVAGADSVVVRYGTFGNALDSTTAAVAVTDGAVEVPLLGLLPDTRYRLRLLAFARHATAESPTLEVRTGVLPADLPRYTAGGPAPQPGVVAFAAGMYGLVIDNTGRVVWYHRFPNGPGLNFMALPSGRFAARPSTPDPGDLDPWVEIDVLGRVTRTFGCARGLQARVHDLIALPDGSAWLLCDETRTVDLTALGGPVAAPVTGTGVQRIGPAGELFFDWSPFDHLAITDVEPATPAGTSFNWTHGNALDLTADGHLVVSFRNLSEITMIDTHTGAVRWRMGGRANQFTFEGTPAPAFARQHGLRVTGPGELLLLDNLGDPASSRAERYAYDPVARTVRLLGSYGPAAPVTASLGGTTQALPGGHILVSFGTAGRVEEYDLAGNLVWQIEGNAGYVFRAQRIRSLYPVIGGGAALR